MIWIHFSRKAGLTGHWKIVMLNLAWCSNRSRLEPFMILSTLSVPSTKWAALPPIGLKKIKFGTQCTVWPAAAVGGGRWLEPVSNPYLGATQLLQEPGLTRLAQSDLYQNCSQFNLNHKLFTISFIWEIKRKRRGILITLHSKTCLKCAEDFCFYQ